MPIQFTCPHCGKQTTVADQYAGQTGPCSACGHPVTIPGEKGETVQAPLPKSTATAAAVGAGTGSVVAIIVVVCVLGFLACGGILVALLLPAVQSARGAARRTQCNNNLRQVALAMHNYHDTYGSLPPAYVADEDGNPMYSWRVLILPFLEQSALYDQFDLNEPWDSPRNLALSNTALEAYRCPSATSGSPTETNYMVVTGPTTVFPGAESIGFAGIRDGTSNTIMVVEVVGTGANWAEPVDLDVSQITFPLSNGSITSPGSQHPGGAQVAMCDGSCQFIVNTISPQTFNAMLTRAGGEIVMPGY